MTRPQRNDGPMPEQEPTSAGTNRLVACATVAITLWDAVALWFAYHSDRGVRAGNDAAGAGMSRAFQELIALGIGAIVLVLAASILLIRYTPVKLALLVVLTGVSLLPVLLV